MSTNRDAFIPGPKLAIVLSHPTQYYSPWFRWLHANTSLRIKVFYLWEFGVKVTRDHQFQSAFAWDVDLVSGYKHEFIKNTAMDPGTHHFSGLRNPELNLKIQEWSPSAILLFGYKSPSQLSLIGFARARGIPLIFRGDSHLMGRKQPALYSRLALRILYSQFSGVTFVGAANFEYFRALGVPCKKLFFAPHAVNDALFDPSCVETQETAIALRKSLHLAPSIRVVLFAGKLVPAKQPLELLAAFMELNAPNAALVFVGDGEERARLMETARGATPGAVHFLPFANQSEMPSRYAMADIFVLPSRGFYETWGLAVNEAMHLGVPALVSDRVGCQRDLVVDGATGWTFRADDYAHLKLRLSEALNANLEGMKPRIAAQIARYTYPHAAAGLVAAVEHCVGPNAKLARKV